MRRNVANAINRMMTEPIGLCLAEADITEEEQALVMATLIDVAKNNTESHKRKETTKEWATRMGSKVEALERQVDKLTSQIRSQNEFFLRMAEALDAAITRWPPGRFSERLKLVRPDTVRADEIQKHMNKAEEARQRHDELMMIAEIVERANTAPEEERFLPRVEMTTCDTAQD